MICRGWYIHTPERYKHSPGWKIEDPPEKTPTQLPILYEGDILEEDTNLRGRARILLTKQIWKSPEIEEAVGYSIGVAYYFSKTNIFYSRNHAIQEHQKIINKIIKDAEQKLQQQTEVLLNYDQHLTDEKYISPFTGEER